MSPRGTITVLVDNHATGPGLIAEHGWAVRLDLGTRRILFDTGQTNAILANVLRLGIDLSETDTIVLSHGHYDHTGGLADVLDAAGGGIPVYAHPGALGPKYHHGDKGVRSIGMPPHCLERVQPGRAKVRTVTGPTEIAPGLFLTGPIPRRHRQEEDDEGFRLDREGRQVDPLTDDQALFRRTPAGTIVLLGCAHAGLINTLDYIQHRTGGEPIHTILGGMHLRSASDERIAWTVKALQQFSIERFYPAHCTGTRPVAAFEAAFPGRCLPCGVGTTRHIEGL
jgi:7,8-dihydropterin-6-yl-methyl-4-(beta-D-ribofuranosyl)aminobenzene 5'-phosphate synthase